MSKRCAHKKLLGIDANFTHELMNYVFSKYNLPFLIKDLLKYRLHFRRALAFEATTAILDEKKGEKNHIGQGNANRIGKHLKFESPFCDHVGEAVIAISHYYRKNYKLMFDENFDKCVESAANTQEHLISMIYRVFKDDYRKCGKLNEMLVVYSIVTEFSIYMSFRGEFIMPAFVWDTMGKIYHAALKEKFEMNGGWPNLKRAARPWWKCYREALERRVELHRPEYVYYNQNLVLHPSYSSPIPIVADIYIDEQHPDDLAYTRVRKKQDEQATIACRSDGCYYFCKQFPPTEVLYLNRDKEIKVDDKSKAKSSKVSKKSKKSASGASEIQPASGASEVPSASGASEVPSASGMSTDPSMGEHSETFMPIDEVIKDVSRRIAELEFNLEINRAIIAVPVPPLMDDLPITEPPHGFLSRDSLKSKFEIDKKRIRIINHSLIDCKTCVERNFRLFW